MDENDSPRVPEGEVDGFRGNLASIDARADFYEPITHPFPPDPSDPETDASKTQVGGLTCDVPARLSPQHGDVEGTEATPKRSVSQEIVDAAHRSERAVTSEEPTVTEMDAIATASTKSLFKALIVTPSRGSSRTSRRDSDTTPIPPITEVDAVPHHEERPRYHNNRATTLPAKLECKVFDPSAHPKLTRWEVLKRKFYLGAAHNLPPSRVMAQDGALGAQPASRASVAGPIDVDSFCEVTNIEGLDLEGLPPMTQRSRKLFSWTRLKTGLTGLKRNKGGGGKGRSDEDGPKGEPDEAAAIAQAQTDDDDDVDEEDEEEGAGGATTSKLPAKDKSHSWFEVLSHRIFTATRRQRSAEVAPARPSTAHTQQYYEIESNW